MPTLHVILPVLLSAASLLPLTSAGAENLTSYVSTQNGDDSNPCTLGRPCYSFNAAIAVTVAGGEVMVLTPGQYGGASIGKAITIRASGIPVTISGTFEIAAGASGKVELDGLDFRAIILESGSETDTTDIAYGVDIQSASEVVVRDTSIRDYAIAGIVLRNTGNVRLTIDNSRLSYNKIGIQVQSSPSMGHVKIVNSILLSNAVSGIQIAGAGNDALLAGTQILGSPKALDFVSGGSAKSYGSNVLTNGDVPAKIPLN
jgi:hypothetical protein